MALLDLSDYCLVFNPTKAPQHYINNIVPPRGYLSLPKTTAQAMVDTQIPIVMEGHRDFPVLFKGSDGSGIIR